MTNALVAAERWLYAVLSNEPTLMAFAPTRFYGHMVPPNTAYPIVFFTLAAAADNVTTVEANVIWSEFVYAVRAVDRVESYVALEEEAAAIEDALSRASGSNASGVIVSCVYQAPFAMLEVDRDGYELRHLGGLYRLSVQ